MPTATTRRTTRRTDWDRITPATRILVSHHLGRLGHDEGVIEDIPPVTDPGERQWHSQQIADALHMHLDENEEMTQCAQCLAVVAGDDAVPDTSEGYTFCDADCLRAWEYEQEAAPARLTA